MKLLKETTLYMTVGLIAPAFLSQPSHAKIKCNGSFQVSKGARSISTPYCQDQHLASVAHEFGIRVSAKAIRQNPSKKEEVCSMVGFDNRIKDVCSGYLPEDN